MGIAEQANEWREENDHLIGGFEMEKQCVGFSSREWLHEEVEDGLRFDQKNIPLGSLFEHLQIRRWFLDVIFICWSSSHDKLYKLIKAMRIRR